MKDFQTRTTELLEELKESLDNRYLTSFTTKVTNDNNASDIKRTRQIMTMEQLTSSEKLAFIAITLHQGDTFATGDMRKALPNFTRVSVSRYIKKLLELGLIRTSANSMRRYEINHYRIY